MSRAVRRYSGGVAYTVSYIWSAYRIYTKVIVDKMELTEMYSSYSSFSRSL